MSDAVNSPCENHMSEQSQMEEGCSCRIEEAGKRGHYYICCGGAPSNEQHPSDWRATVKQASTREGHSQAQALQPGKSNGYLYEQLLDGRWG